MAPNKRKKPVTVSSNKPNATVAADVTRRTIRRYHVLLKEKARLLSDASSSTSTRLNEIEKEMNDLGGLEAYQEMSVLGQSKERGGGSEKVLVEWLRQLGYGKPTAGKGKEREMIDLLEVGALHPDNYAQWSKWIRCVPIDLHSRHPDIKEQDFLLMDRTENEGHWDVVSLSLVLNFASTPVDRGAMLTLAHAFLKPAGASYLYLVLPLPCITNSRFLTPEHLKSLMDAIGFDLVKERWKPGGKVAYWLWKKHQGGGDAEGFGKKKVLREGASRNNFAILWDGSR
ncbi:nucleolus protein [Calocera viscosa TUFC12733]|uniref:25S rRNA adenine-N(1) methyltransferase n=1 Tax=Calocera viscosa (strain TUFC12733) TaxID=1330018 RepID=A0A167K5S3_CALVF|nr:nucleolus protein [Calocera viscosa TUFC12733]